jgi:hypothetical protein
MNRQERSSSMMKDMVSIIEVGCGVVWDCVVDMSTQVYRVFKNDNKSIEIVEKKVGHDMGGNYKYDDMIYRSSTPGCHTPGNSNDEVSYDSNQNENNTNVQDEDGVDEDDWRDRFTGWLP